MGAQECYPIRYCLLQHPPYEWEHYEDLAKGIIDHKLLAEGVKQLLSTATRPICHLPGFTEHRRYGHVNFSFFSNPGEIEED